MTFKKVKIIEDLPLDLGDRVDLLLVYANQKPSTEIFIPSHYFNTKTDFQEFASYINKELPYINKPFINDGFDFFYRDPNTGASVELAKFYIGKDKSWCERLKNSYDSCNSHETGICYGFPETAIGAFHGDRKRLMTDLYDGTPESFFTQFIFSKESFKEEFKSTSVRWHDTVKKLSKKIYSEVKKEAYSYFDPHHSGYDYWTELMHSDEPAEDWALEKIWWS